MKKTPRKTIKQLSMEFELSDNTRAKSQEKLNRGSKETNIYSFPKTGSDEISFRDRVKADLIKNKVIVE